MITNVYIDGLNLYYRALKSTRLKWLDIRKLSETLFPDDQIHRVSYFTSRLIQRPGHSDQINRQLIYLRALRTLPEVDIYYGKMRLRQMRRPLVAPIPGLPTTVEVESPEEKGTDVNLATRLLMDGFRGEYEQAAIISTMPILPCPCVA